MNTRTTSPSEMPRPQRRPGACRAAARPATLPALAVGLGSSWLCRRVGWSDSRCSGWRCAASAPSHSAGRDQTGMARDSRPGRSRDRLAEDLDPAARGSSSGCAAGSARNASSMTGGADWAAIATTPACQKPSKSGRTTPTCAARARGSPRRSGAASRSVSRPSVKRSRRAKPRRRGRRRSRSRRALRRQGASRAASRRCGSRGWRSRCRRAPASSSPAARCRPCARPAFQNCSCTTTVSGLLPGAGQAVEVLVMVERIAAGPVDQPDIGVGMRRAVVVEGLARDAAACRRCARPG